MSTERPPTEVLPRQLGPYTHGRLRRLVWHWGLIMASVLVLAGTDRVEAQTDPGWVQGELRADPGPARRWASRYPGGGANSGRLQEVRPVVYLDGLQGAASVETGGTVELAQRDRQFTPSTLVVTPGTVLSFPNRDPFFHNVFSFSAPARFDLGRYPEGETREVELTETGIVKIYCEVHEFMRAVVLVTDHELHAVVGEDGSFRIDGVPPGTYTLVAYHPDVGESRTEIQVTSGEGAVVELTLGSTR